jgi:hypothetical protein
MTKRLKLISGSIGLVVFIVIGTVINHFINGPSDGTISVSTVQPTSKPVVTMEPVTTAYANFSYPSSFTQQTSSEPIQSPVLANLIYTKSDVTHWQLIVSIISVNQAALTADSGYLLRVSQPTNYQASTSKVAATGQKFTVLRDVPTGDYNAVAYSLHGSTVAEVAIDGSDNSGNSTVEATLQSVLATWRWR